MIDFFLKNPTVVVGLVAIGVTVFVSVVLNELRRVRSARIAAAPDLACGLNPFEGRESGFHAHIHNRSQHRALNVKLTIPTMGVVWEKPWIEKDAWERPRIVIPDGTPLRTAQQPNPIAILRFNDKFGNEPHELHIPLTQTPYPEGHFGLGSSNDHTMMRPRLGAWTLWKMRKKV